MQRNHDSHVRLAPLDAKALVAELAPIQRTILAGLVGGGSTGSLARSLRMDPAVLEKHRAVLMKKLNADTTAEAVRIGLLAGMDEPPDRTDQD